MNMIRKFSLFFCFLLVCGCSFASGRTDDDPPPFGELVEIDGRSAHVRIMGSGAPTVLCFSDIDLYGSLNWDELQKMTRDSSKTISFDRYGYLWSDEGVRPRTGERIASELESILAAKNEDGPFILVCHGMGGIYGRIFAGRNREKIFGIILLDPVNPDLFERIKGSRLKKPIPHKNLRPVIWLMLKLGLKKNNLQQYGIPDELYNVASHYYEKGSLAWFDETAASKESMAEAKKYDDFGDLPVRIITSNKVSTDASDLERLWVDLQRELLSLSDNSEQSLVAVGHYIHMENPELVAEEIAKMVRQYRNSN